MVGYVDLSVRLQADQDVVLQGLHQVDGLVDSQTALQFFACSCDDPQHDD